MSYNIVQCIAWTGVQTYKRWHIDLCIITLHKIHCWRMSDELEFYGCFYEYDTQYLEEQLNTFGLLELNLQK